MKKTLFSVMLFALFISSGRADDINTTGQLFLIQPGARSVGMGGCGTLLGEGTSGLYNPAAQALAADVNATIFSCPHPYYTSGFDFLVLQAGAKSDFGYIGIAYLSRQGVDGTNYPPEEATALIMAGKPFKRHAFSLGFALKILTTTKANFTPINQSPNNTFKMTVDLGTAYAGLFPQLTLVRTELNDDDLRQRFGRKFTEGISVGLAFQNIGGRVKFEDSIDPEMLPQTFRADLSWYVLESRHGTLLIATEVQKLLIARNSAGGYQGATTSFFQAWGGGAKEGAWTSRLGVELSLLGLISGRIGWSIEHKNHLSFLHRGFGLGPEWLRLNAAWVRQPGLDFSLEDQARFDLSANVTFDQVRHWLKTE
jgi:hypothetical protein